ncbi:MAG: cyclic nucleotide-binding domain-containing protein [Dehalococcoidia bacterium]
MPVLEPQEHWDLVRECALFQEFGDSELSRILPIARERHFASGSAIADSGEHAEALYVIADGLVRVPSLMGTPSSLMMSSPEVFGISGLVPPHRYLKSAIASTDCRVLEIPIPALRAMVERDHSLSRRLMARTAAYLHQRLVEAISDAHGHPIGNYLR